MLFGFWLCTQRSKYVFVFLEKFSAENNSAYKSVGKVFLWFKLDRGSWVHLPTLSLNCGGIKRNVDDQNIDMIFIMLLDNIYMGITS
jgi:hypothetical protein